MAKVMRVESPKSIEEADTSSISSMSSSDCSNSQTQPPQPGGTGTTPATGDKTEDAVPSDGVTGVHKMTSNSRELVEDGRPSGTNANPATPSTSRSTGGGSIGMTRNRAVDQQFEIKIRRCLLFNKLVDLMPESLCQPKKNISDFVLL